MKNVVLVGALVLAGCAPSPEDVAAQKLLQDTMAGANQNLAIAQQALAKAAELHKHYYEVTLPHCRAAFDALKIGSSISGMDMKCDHHFHTTETASGKHDQIVFDDVGNLYFDNGRLTAKQRSY